MSAIKKRQGGHPHQDDYPHGRQRDIKDNMRTHDRQYYEHQEEGQEKEDRS